LTGLIQCGQCSRNRPGAQSESRPPSTWRAEIADIGVTGDDAPPARTAQEKESAESLHGQSWRLLSNLERFEARGIPGITPVYRLSLPRGKLVRAQSKCPGHPGAALPPANVVPVELQASLAHHKQTTGHWD
jgi:hypothetical protein